MRYVYGYTFKNGPPWWWTYPRLRRMFEPRLRRRLERRFDMRPGALRQR